MASLLPAHRDRVPERYMASNPTLESTTIAHHYNGNFPWYAVNGGIAGGEVTGATAGTPGSFTPAGATIPGDLAELQSMGALGQTLAWTTGQYVELRDGSQAHWDGSAWAEGAAP